MINTHIPNLSNIKILIIEDENEVIKAITQALCKLENNIGGRFTESNIHTQQIDGIELRSPQDIYNTVSSTIEKENIDVLFIDLNFGETTKEGLNFIRLLLNHPIFASIPKYIITGEDRFLEEKDEDGNFINTDIEHFCTIYHKPSGQYKPDEYQELFNRKQLVSSLPILVSLYRREINNLNFGQFLTKIEHFSAKNEIAVEEITSYILSQIELVKNIDKKANSILDKVTQIDIVTKAIAQSLPKIASKKQAKEIVQLWEKNTDFQKIMGDQFPKLPKGLFNAMKDMVEQMGDNITEDISKHIYEAGKKYVIDYLDDQARVQEHDDTLTITLKYSAFFVESVSNFLLKK